MIITLIFLLFLCLYGIRFGKSYAYNGYISKDRTNAIKGIFILIVFISHIRGYIVDAGYEYHGIGDMVFQTFFSLIGQLMVVMFLFYSGYGVMESIRRKGEAYVKAMPKHRVLNTLVNFDVAVCVFLVVDLIIGKEVTMQKFLLSLITWDSLGNSNWYIFAIIVCYLVTSIVARITKDEYAVLGGVFAVLTVVAIGLYFVKESWWYNTLWSYTTGMFYSIFKKKIELIVNRRYPLVLVLMLVAFCLFFILPLGLMGFKTNTLGIIFSLLIVVLTMRVKIDNCFLRWCGEQLFPLYIYQRIPMMIFASCLPIWMLKEQLVVYVTICFVSALIITYLYSFFRISL